ncbi:MAG: sensor histidine kinase, partial [Burkholderiaceae bacterium]|nr:sensor histidine kinase [Burkholderiaceae bacterium]
MLILLIMITALAWIQSFRVFSEIPFSKTVSHQIVSTANLTRYALVTADVDLRPHLLRTLAYQEGLRVLPRETHDEYTPLVGTGNIVELVEAQTREVLGEDTVLAGTVNGEA